MATPKSVKSYGSPADDYLALGVGGGGGPSPGAQCFLDGDDAGVTSEVTSTPVERCTACLRPIEPERVRAVGDVERFSCLGCGLQLLRRRDEPWTQIRG